MNARLLLVMHPQRRLSLLRILEMTSMEVSLAAGVREAEAKLSEPDSFDLVFVDAELPDGSWKDLLQFLLQLKKTCEMIVCCRCGSEQLCHQLWAEVIQCGAYDLIPEPYEEREVARIARSALDSQYIQRFVQPSISRMPKEAAS